MGHNETMIMFVAHETKQAVLDCKSEDLKEKAKAAMTAARGHFMVTDEGMQFDGACAGLLMATEGEEKAKVERDLAGLKALSAMMGGVPVDLGAVELDENPLGLMGIWKQLRAEAGR